MPPQTTKKPSGKFNKQHLKEYLRKQAKESKVGEDYVPFVRKSRPQSQSSTGEPKSPSDPFPSEFDEVLEGLTEEEIAELASACIWE